MNVIGRLKLRRKCDSEQMEHRHINTKDNEWGVAAVHSIWERGSEDDICALILEE